MAKYITLDTTSDGVVQVNTDDILLAKNRNSTSGEIILKGGAKKITVTGTALGVKFASNVNAALTEAAVTNWHNAIVPVSTEGGLVFTSIAVGDA